MLIVKIIGSVIARQDSKRLTYKNLLPYKGEPLVLRAVRKLLSSRLFDEVVLSTESDLIAFTCMNEPGLRILKRPPALCEDSVPSIPVFQHIMQHFPGDLHLNYNCNFPECPDSAFIQAIELAKEKEESLSIPYAVWAQTQSCLDHYGDPFKIKAQTFQAEGVGEVDVHTMEDLIKVHRNHFKASPW